MSVLSKTSGAEDYETDYPKLRSLINDEGRPTLVVLFTSSGKGTVVFVDKSSVFGWDLGEYTDNWSKREFEDYDGEIKLKNA